MRNLLIALTGFLIAAGVVVAVAVAVPRLATVTALGGPMAGTMGNGMMAGVAAPATAKLTIQHVQKGCHVWSNGKTTAAMMRLRLKVGRLGTKTVPMPGALEIKTIGPDNNLRLVVTVA